MSLHGVNRVSAGPFDRGASVSVIGPSGGVYVAGRITVDQGTATRVARWDGGNWTILGDRLESGLQSTDADAIAVDSAGNVYVSGTFTRAVNGNGGFVTVNRVARWNVQTERWEAMGGGVAVSLARRLAVFGGEVYVGGIGMAYNPGGIPIQVSGIGRWNPNSNSWSPVGQGLSGGNVAVMSTISSGSGVYVAGSFTTATNPGGAQVTVNHIAFWDGNQWHALGQGFFYPISTVFVWTLALNSANEVFAAGMFEEARNLNGTAVNGPIVRWDGAQWHNETQGLPLSPGVATYDAEQVAVDGSDSLCVYYYDTPLLSDIIARRDAQGRWAKIGRYSGDRIVTIAGRPGRLQEGLYAGGLFYQIDDLSTGQMYDVVDNAQWLPQQGWSSMDGGVSRFARHGLNKVIPDLQGTSDTITVSTLSKPLAVAVTEVAVTIDSVIHGSDSDLEFTLFHDGVLDTLIYQAGGSGQNFIRTELADSAPVAISAGAAPFTGQFRPYAPLAQFNGTRPGGSWVLSIRDRAAGTSGTLQAWSLTLRVEPTTDVQEETAKIPTHFWLSQNYPNPFNPTTAIRYQLPVSSIVTLVVYDILGREVATLVNELQPPGMLSVTWDARDMPSGVYLYRLIAGNFVEVKKLVLLK
jgi:hypothetical protein